MIYLIYGEDRFRRQLRLKELGNDEDFKIHDASKLEDICSILNQGNSLFDSNNKQNLIFKNLSIFAEKQEDKYIKFFLETISNQSKTIVLEAESVKATTKLFKELKQVKECKIEQFKKFKSWEQKECLQWLSQALKDNSDIKVSTPDLREFIDYIGCEDSAHLYKEIERVAFIHNPLKISHLKEYCLSNYDVFEFIKYLASNQQVKAINELQKIKKDKLQENTLGLLSLLQSNLDTFKTVLLLSQEKFSDDQIASVLNIKSGRVYHLKKDSRNMNLVHIEKLLEKLLDYELRIKTGSLKFLDALSLLVHA